MRRLGRHATATKQHGIASKSTFTTIYKNAAHWCPISSKTKNTTTPTNRKKSEHVMRSAMELIRFNNVRVVVGTQEICCPISSDNSWTFSASFRNLLNLLPCRNNQTLDMMMRANTTHKAALTRRRRDITRSYGIGSYRRGFEKQEAGAGHLQRFQLSCSFLSKTPTRKESK